MDGKSALEMDGKSALKYQVIVSSAYYNRVKLTCSSHNQSIRLLSNRSLTAKSFSAAGRTVNRARAKNRQSGR